MFALQNSEIFFAKYSIFYVFIDKKGIIYNHALSFSIQEREGDTMKKRIFYLIAVFLLCVLFSGCSQNADQATEQSAPQIEQESSKTPEQIKAETIENIMEDMTIEEKVGQLLMMDFRKNADDTDMTVLSEEAAQQIADYHLGGVILFAENLDTLEQSQALVNQMQEAADMQLFIGIDEEGGMVSRLDKSQIPHVSVPNAAQLQGDTAQAKQAGVDIGTTLAKIGVNVDFAPVADVYTNPDNTVIGERAYGTDANTVADMAAAFMQGLEAQGVKATAKHFPGHGDTAADSHDGMAISDHDLTRLQEIEFVPFSRLVQEGIDFVMVGHITMPQVTDDGLPASLSPQAIALLREDIGFDGIVITDAMNMGAIVSYYPDGQAAVQAIQAGVDIVLMPSDLEEAYLALLDAIGTGEISQTRLDESIRRILEVKYDSGMLLQYAMK